MTDDEFAHYRIDKLEEEIKQLRADMERLKIEKANCEPFRWLQHRVGQLQRRLDNIYGPYNP